MTPETHTRTAQEREQLVTARVNELTDSLEKMVRTYVPTWMFDTLPARALARGLIVNHIMLDTLKEHGPGTVAILAEMYEDRCRAETPAMGGKRNG